MKKYTNISSVYDDRRPRNPYPSFSPGTRRQQQNPNPRPNPLYARSSSSQIPNRVRQPPYPSWMQDTASSQKKVSRNFFKYGDSNSRSGGAIAPTTENFPISMPYPSASPPKFQGESPHRKPLSANSNKARLNLSDISRISVEEIYDQIFMDSKPNPASHSLAGGGGSSALMRKAREIMLEQQQERGRRPEKRSDRSGSGSVNRTRSASAGRRVVTRSSSAESGKRRSSISMIEKRRIEDLDYEEIERMRNWSSQLRR